MSQLAVAPKAPSLNIGPDSGNSSTDPACTIQQRPPTATATLEWMKRWPEIQAQIVARPHLLLALSFDGILSPTVAHPSEANLPEDTRALLAKLGASPRITLAFLSGRSLADIENRIRLPDAFFAGNHGMEVHGPSFRSSDGLAVSCRSDLVDALAFLARFTKRLRGVFVEDKGLSITVHWRMANPGEDTVVRELLDIIVRSHPRLKVFAGEACCELRARASWNKGDAIRQILTHLHLPATDTIYIGEEFTDGDAFAQLSEGLTFCVGGTASAAARFRLPARADAAQLLFCILSAVNGMSLT